MGNELRRIADEPNRNNPETATRHGEWSHAFSSRDLASIAVLAALWSASEDILGAQLHAVHLPFTGVTLTAIAVFLMVTERALVPRRGSTILMGIVVALLKMFSIGGVVLPPMIAIFMEALAVELTTTAGGVNRLSAAIGGILAEMWTLVQAFVAPLLFGVGMLSMYRMVVSSGSQLLGFALADAIAILVVLIVLHGVVGAVAGLVGWRFSVTAKRLLAR